MRKKEDIIKAFMKAFNWSESLETPNESGGPSDAQISATEDMRRVYEEERRCAYENRDLVFDG